MKRELIKEIYNKYLRVFRKLNNYKKYIKLLEEIVAYEMGISVEQLRNLKMNNYKKYIKLLKEK